MGAQDKKHVFEEGVITYLEGILTKKQLEKERPLVLEEISDCLGYYHFKFLRELYFKYATTGEMPGEESVRKLPDADKILTEYYNGDPNNLFQEWKTYFEGFQLEPFEIKMIQGYQVGVPKKVFDNTISMMDIKGIIEVFTENRRHRKKLALLFEHINAKQYHSYLSVLNDPKYMPVRSIIEPDFETRLEYALGTAIQKKKERRISSEDIDV